MERDEVKLDSLTRKYRVQDDGSVELWCGHKRHYVNLSEFVKHVDGYPHSYCNTCRKAKQKAIRQAQAEAKGKWCYSATAMTKDSLIVTGKPSTCFTNSDRFT